MNRRVASWLAAIAIIATFAVRVGLDAVENSATFDEPEYIVAGYSYVATGDLRLERWHPPLAFLLAGIAVRARFDLPLDRGSHAWTAARSRDLAREVVYAPDRDAPAIIHTARVPSLLLGLVTILAIGSWAAQLWGVRAGWVALVLAAFDPNLIAHASVATPDIGLTCFTVLAMYAAWRYLRAPSWPRWIAICVGCALALLTKHVAFVLGPIIAAALVDAVVREPAQRRTIGRALAVTVLALIAAMLGAAIAGLPIADLGGRLFDGVRSQLGHITHVQPAYLRGEISRKGWWHYYLVVLALKVPLGTLALVAVSAIRWRAGAALTRATAIAVVAPAVLVVLVVSITRIDLGVRLILPAIPFAILLAARAATLPGVWWQRFVIGAVAATAISSAVATTAELAYFNEAAWVLGGGDHWLSDSNLDWGQDLDRLGAYLRDTAAPPVYLAYFGGGSPTYAGLRHASLPTNAGMPLTADLSLDRSEPEAPCKADRQLIAISRFRQQGVSEAPSTRYAWLAKFQPIAEVGTTFRIYDITADAESHVKLALLFGMDTPTGACELARARAIDPRTVPRSHRYDASGR